MRRALIAALLALAARPARAEQCHGWSGTTWRSPGVVAGVRVDAAGYRNTSYTGNFEGLAPILGYTHPRLSVQATMPAYRIVRNGLAHTGIGDLQLATRVPLTPWSHHALTAGLGVAASFPTGSADHGLGMGHVMLMPEFWWVVTRERVQLYGAAGFGRALSSHAGSHHHGGPAPIVNPMNQAEVGASLGAQLRVHRLLWLRFNAWGAMPVGTVNAAGVTRVVAAQGLVLSLKKFDLALELQAPLTGSPFLARGVLQATWRFDVGRRRG